MMFIQLSRVTLNRLAVNLREVFRAIALITSLILDLWLDIADHHIHKASCKLQTSAYDL